MPRTRSLAWSELKIGIVSLFAVAIAAVLIFMVSGEGGFFWQRYSLKTVFSDIQGLKEGAPVRVAGLEMHPIDSEDRLPLVKEQLGLGYCNITKCCTEVCPEHIKITDNAIIPLKERVVDRYYDPVQWVWRKITGKG